MRSLVFAFLLIGAFGNAAPSLTAIRPQVASLSVLEDDLAGSGYEARAEQPSRQTIKRLRAKRPLDAAIAALEAARAQLLHCEPGLADLLAAAFPRMRRNDVVGTMIRSGDSICFNRTYVLSLSPEQLLDHLWQLAVSLETPY